jgi:pSer/pThr/pTyr-binding forkhead associated (FHA) protein
MASTDPAHSDAHSPALIPLGSHANAAPIEIKRPITVIGSRKEIVRLHLQSSTISKAHCVIVLNRWGCYVHDLGSRTGTQVNGKSIVDQDLADGDVLQVGRFQFKYRAPKNAKPKPQLLPPAEVSVSTLAGKLQANKRVLVVGRRAGADIEFADSRVSNIHALIVEQDGRRLVRDLASRTGTWLDEKPVHQEPLADGAELKVGGAVICITDRPQPIARGADAPITLADAAPAAAGFAVADLAPLELDEDDAKSFRPDDTLPAADDLASLRREWQTPAKAAEIPPVPPVADKPAEVESEQELSNELPPLEPADAGLEIDLSKAEAAAEDELDLDDPDFDAPLQLEPAEDVKAEKPAVEPSAEPTPAGPVAESPAGPAEALLELDDLLADAPQVTADAEVERFHTPPAAAEVAADVERPALDPLAEAPAAQPAQTPAEPLADASLDDLLADAAVEPLDIEALAEQELGLGLAAPSPAETEAEKLAEVPPTAASETPTEVDDLELDDLLADAPQVTADTEVETFHTPPVSVEPAAEADRPALDPLAVAGSETSTAPGAEVPADTEVTVDEPLDIEALAEAELGLSPAGEATSEFGVGTPDAEARLAAEAIESEPLAELELDEDGPAGAADAENQSLAPLPRDPDAPATVEGLADSAVGTPLPPELAVPTENVLAAPLPETPAEEPEVDLEPLDLEELDLSDLQLEADPDAPDGVTNADVDALTLDPDAPAEVSAEPELKVSDTPSDIGGEVESTGDLINLSADLDAAEAEPVGAEALGESTSAALAPATDEEASAETVGGAADRPTADDLVVGHLPALDEAAPASEDPTQPTAGDTLKLDTNTAAPAAFVPPAEPPIEPDRIRLDDDLAVEEEADDATALAVDLGLVLEDDHEVSGLHALADATPREPAPADPGDINLADARPVVPNDGAREGSTDSIDLSHLGPIEETTFTRPAGPPLSPAAERDQEHTGEDLFDADEIELIEPDAPTAQSPAGPDIAAEAPKQDDNEPKEEIRPPSGGSLRDLIPGGPPLLGGSFMSMPPAIPSVPRFSGPADRGPKNRPGRVGFGGEPRGRRPAPFAAERTIADAMGGVEDDGALDELVSGHGPSIDAFSGSPATSPSNGRAASVPNEQAEALDETDAASDDATLMSPPERQRPRGTIRPVVLAPAAAPASSDLAASAGILATARPAVPVIEVETGRAKLHRKRVRRVITLLVAMLVLIGGAAWAIYTFLPVLTTVDAQIKYEGLKDLGTEEQKAFQSQKDAILLSEPVRQRAIQGLPQDLKDTGFLTSSTSIYETVIRDSKVRWPAELGDTMRLRVRSSDKQNDVSRLRALGQAMVSASATDDKQRSELMAKSRDIETQIANWKNQINLYNKQLDDIDQAQQQRGVVKDKAALNAEYLAAEPALTQIKSKRQELEAEIIRLKLPIAQTATSSNVDPATSDDELAKLTKQLNELQQPAPRPENTAEGAEARKKLDDAIAQFQNDLNAAGKVRDNPELSAYVESANAMFAQFRQLTEGFIRRQENTRQRLTELKTTLSDKQQARTQAVLEADADLKKLKDSLAILERQRNAAEAQGFAEDAKKSDLEMRLLKVKIGEREDKARNDTGFGEAITGIQSVIDQSEKELAIDRKSIDERLTALQTDFVKNAPGGVSLTADQKKMAEGFQAKLASMNEARRAYDAAAEKAQQEAKAAEQASAQKINELRLQIAARRQDVLAAVKARQQEQDEAFRKTRLAAADKELAAIREQEQAAQARLTAAATAIEQAEKQRRIEVAAAADRQDKVVKKSDAEKELAAVQRMLGTNQASLARLIVPDPKVDLMVFDDVDRRHLIAALAAGGIALLLLIPIIMDLLALAREHHPHHPPANSSTPGFEPLLAAEEAHKALPEPASV